MKWTMLAAAAAAFCVGCAYDDYDRGGMGGGVRSETGYESSSATERDPVMNDTMTRDRSFPGRPGPGGMDPHLPY